MIANNFSILSAGKCGESASCLLARTDEILDASEKIACSYV